MGTGVLYCGREGERRRRRRRRRRRIIYPARSFEVVVVVVVVWNVVSLSCCISIKFPATTTLSVFFFLLPPHPLSVREPTSGSVPLRQPQEQEAHAPPQSQTAKEAHQPHRRVATSEKGEKQRNWFYESSRSRWIYFRWALLF